jgi:transcription antitermination protein NusB
MSKTDDLPTTPPIRQANKRGAARLAAVQALYQMDVAVTGLLEISAEYEAYRLGKEVDGAVYREADGSGRSFPGSSRSRRRSIR